MTTHVLFHANESTSCLSKQRHNTGERRSPLPSADRITTPNDDSQGTAKSNFTKPDTKATGPNMYTSNKLPASYKVSLADHHQADQPNPETHPTTTTSECRLKLKQLTAMSQNPSQQQRTASRSNKNKHPSKILRQIPEHDEAIFREKFTNNVYQDLIVEDIYKDIDKEDTRHGKRSGKLIRTKKHSIVILNHEESREVTMGSSGTTPTGATVDQKTNTVVIEGIYNNFEKLERHFKNGKVITTKNHSLVIFERDNHASDGTEGSFDPTTTTANSTSSDEEQEKVVTTSISGSSTPTLLSSTPTLLNHSEDTTITTYPSPTDLETERKGPSVSDRTLVPRHSRDIEVIEVQEDCSIAYDDNIKNTVDVMEDNIGTSPPPPPPRCAESLYASVATSKPTLIDKENESSVASISSSEATPRNSQENDSPANSVDHLEEEDGVSNDNDGSTVVTTEDGIVDLFHDDNHEVFVAIFNDYENQSDSRLYHYPGSYRGADDTTSMKSLRSLDTFGYALDQRSLTSVGSGVDDSTIASMNIVDWDKLQETNNEMFEKLFRDFEEYRTKQFMTAEQKRTDVQDSDLSEDSVGSFGVDDIRSVNSSRSLDTFGFMIRPTSVVSAPTSTVASTASSAKILNDPSLVAIKDADGSEEEPDVPKSVVSGSSVLSEITTQSEKRFLDSTCSNIVSAADRREETGGISYENNSENRKKLEGKERHDRQYRDNIKRAPLRHHLVPIVLAQLNQQSYRVQEICFNQNLHSNDPKWDDDMSSVGLLGVETIYRRQKLHKNTSHKKDIDVIPSVPNVIEPRLENSDDSSIDEGRENQRIVQRGIFRNRVTRYDGIEEHGEVQSQTGPTFSTLWAEGISSTSGMTRGKSVEKEANLEINPTFSTVMADDADSCCSNSIKGVPDLEIQQDDGPKEEMSYDSPSYCHRFAKKIDGLILTENLWIVINILLAIIVFAVGAIALYAHFGTS